MANQPTITIKVTLPDKMLRDAFFGQCMPHRNTLTGEGNLSFRHGWSDEWQPPGTIRGMWTESAPDEIIKIVEETTQIRCGYVRQSYLGFTPKQDNEPIPVELPGYRMELPVNEMAESID